MPIKTTASDLVNKGHRAVTDEIFFPKPYVDPLCFLVYFRHPADLDALLVQICLVDAQRINPHISGLVPIPLSQSLQCLKQIWPYHYALIIDLDLMDLGLLTPDIAQGVIIGMFIDVEFLKVA